MKALFYLRRFSFVTKSQLENKLTSSMKIQTLEVIDTSGGCGSQFVIKIKSPDFNGKNLIAQHRMVNEILKEELKEIHSLQLKTEADKI
jgi:stress-induced morphogen